PGRVHRRAPAGGGGGRPLRRRPPPAGGRRPPGAARPARRRHRRGLDRGPAPGPAGLPAVRRPPPGPGQLSQQLSLGVEEEYQLIDPATRELRSVAPRVLPAAESAMGRRIQPELDRSMVEMNTAVCSTLAEVREAVRQGRRSLVEAAGQQGLRIAAAGTHPFSHWRDQRATDKPRYHNLAEDYQQVFREQVVVGCHVHVGIDDREAAIQTMNRARPWLPVLAALTVNSPYWLGGDTGYARHRAGGR